jgi:zinc finger SWIM domain-containing protein 3
MEFIYEATTYSFYSEYVRLTGFSIRREYINISKKDGVLTSRNFTCNKEGYEVMISEIIKQKRLENKLNKTHYPAKMVISLDRKAGM